jgi:hypothetical protein
LNFSYDGFGNRTAQTAIKGSAPSWQQAVDPTNNHVVGGKRGRKAGTADLFLQFRWQAAQSPPQRADHLEKTVSVAKKTVSVAGNAITMPHHQEAGTLDHGDYQWA